MEHWKIENNRLYLNRFDKVNFSLELLEDTRKYVGPNTLVELLNMAIRDINEEKNINIEQVTEEETEELREYYETLGNSTE